MDQFTIKIPCKKYIRKYYTTLYGDVLKPTFNDDFGDTIISKLNSKPLHRISQANINNLLKGLDDFLKIQLPIDYFYRIQNTLTDQHTYNLHRFLKNKFDNDLFIFVNICTAFGVERKNAVTAFCNRHNIIIDQDTTIEAMVKKEMRERAQFKPLNKFLVEIGSRFRFDVSDIN